MAEKPPSTSLPKDTTWISGLAQARPDVVIMAPFMIYLLFLPLNDWVPYEFQAVAIAIRGLGALAIVWLFRKHFPPLGKAHLGWALVVGLFAAWGWVAGQHLFDRIGLGGRLILYPGQREITDPLAELGAGPAFWSQVVFRITVASTMVPIVEELFWRGFLLRALIDWDRFEELPLGTFTWLSFLGTSLLSTLEHPDNWGVSILCWLLYNALFIWKKSLLCLMITHGVTNLALYLYVVQTQDWAFW